MAEVLRAVTWEAPEHHHIEKSSDWFWILGILAVAASIVAILFGNILFGIVILLCAAAMTLVAMQEPNVIPFAVTVRGVRVGPDLYPYSTLESFFIDEEHPLGPQLLVKSERYFMPLIIMPIPEDHIDDIESIIETRLPEEHLEEPLAHKILEFFGF